MNNIGKIVAIALCIIFAGGIIFCGFTPVGRTLWNKYDHSMKKADENLYETRKQVEDTARAMISTYKSAVDTYELYKDSDDPEKQSWAEQARMSANRTANTYNEYILKNSYVWEDNIPDDIDYKLPILGNEVETTE